MNPRLRSGIIEVAILLLWFLAFTRLHAAVGKDSVAAAAAHAQALQSMERAVHVDLERAANRWLVEHPAFIEPAVFVYRSYYAAIIGVLLWVFLRRPGVYRPARRAFVAMGALALPVFWLLPMASPRFAVPGIVDIIAEHDPLWGPATRDLASGQNHFSAMPSLHVGWSMWCAYALWSALRTRHPGTALLPWVFPLLTAAVVLTTGNHYVLDIVGSAVLLLVSVSVAWGRTLIPQAMSRRGRSDPPQWSAGGCQDG